MINPHFDLPFRLVTRNGIRAPAVVEQDSLGDVVNCIEAALRTELGSRIDLPTFGISDLTFANQPIGTGDVLAQVEAHEDRGDIVTSEQPDALDSLVDRIVFRVGLKEDNLG